MIESEFNDRGFAIIQGVLRNDEVVELQEEIGRLTNGAHALRNVHECCNAVRKLCCDTSILSLARKIIGENAFVVRSIFFDKNEGANWKVAWHQDLAIGVQARGEIEGFGPWSVKDGIVHVQPPASILERMVTLRVHLDDCTTQNGPLRVLPGSHRRGKLTAEQITDRRARVPEVECIVPSGGVLIMRPLILHTSSRATSAGHRRVVHLEFAAETLPDGLKWAVESPL